MSARLRLTGYAVALGLALGGGIALGAGAGPDPDPHRPAVEHDDHADTLPTPDPAVARDDDPQDA